MLSKETARKLLPFVNDINNFDLLNKYIESRIEYLLKDLKTSKDFNKINEVQGAIKELERFSTLRDEVLRDGKDSNQKT